MASPKNHRTMVSVDGVLDEGGGDRAGQRQEGAGADEQSGREVANQQHHGCAAGVEHQDVTLPEHRVRQSDDEEQGEPPQGEPDDTSSLGFRPVGEHDNTDAEQQREQRHHLLLDEDHGEDTDDPVERLTDAVGRHVEVGRRGEPEAQGVHRQDAERRHASDGIE